MPVSRFYKALVLGGRATVGVPHSEHAPRRGYTEFTVSLTIRKPSCTYHSRQLVREKSSGEPRPENTSLMVTDLVASHQSCLSRRGKRSRVLLFDYNNIARKSLERHGLEIAQFDVERRTIVI